MALMENIKHNTTPSFDLFQPTEQTCPLVVDSPHSCSAYPNGFNPICSREDLLTSWDAWVDELFQDAPSVGAPFLVARFPRFFLDLNRARDDIDLELIDGDLPFQAKPTEKTAKGFGLLRRNALPGVRVHGTKTPAKTLMSHLENYYDPYHTILGDLIDATAKQFGRSVHLDCHSMKSRGNAMNDDNGALRPDVVVSDGFGTTSDPLITAKLANLFESEGFKTQINAPYKGAELITRHGRPKENKHSLQIEMNRALYMHEDEFRKSNNFQAVQKKIEIILNTFSKEI